MYSTTNNKQQRKKDKTMLKNRDFTMFGMSFHLNDNGTSKSARREFEGKYKLMRHVDFSDSWHCETTVNSVKEAKEYVKRVYG